MFLLSKICTRRSLSFTSISANRLHYSSDRRRGLQPICFPPKFSFLQFSPNLFLLHSPIFLFPISMLWFCLKLHSHFSMQQIPHLCSCSSCMQLPLLSGIWRRMVKLCSPWALVRIWAFFFFFLFLFLCFYLISICYRLIDFGPLLLFKFFSPIHVYVCILFVLNCVSW